MSIIFQTIFNILRRREEQKKGNAAKDGASEAPASRPPRPFYPDSEPEEGEEETNHEGETPP